MSFKVGDEVVINSDMDWFWQDYPHPGVVTNIIDKGYLIEVKILCRPTWKTGWTEKIVWHVFADYELQHAN